MRRFVNDDAGYVTWLAGHPHGYVLNTPTGHSCLPSPSRPLASWHRLEPSVRFRNSGRDSPLSTSALASHLVTASVSPPTRPVDDGRFDAENDWP